MGSRYDSAGSILPQDAAEPHITSAYKLLMWLLPSPLTRTAAAKTTPSSGNITALDGLRGIACLIVLHEHWTCAVDDPWRDEALKHLATGVMWRPFVILLWGGEAMVNLFFVISGYVLSYRPLSLLYSSEYQRMYEGVASSVFRRAFRLWLPTIAATVIIAVMARMHVFEPARRVYDAFNNAQEETVADSSSTTRLLESIMQSQRLGPLLIREEPPPMANTTLLQGLDVLREFGVLARTSAAGEVTRHDILIYDKHVWTIPVEFKSSITLFILVVATSTFQTRWRLLVHGTVLLFCALQEYPLSLFVAGMLVAEIDLMRKHRGTTPKERNKGPIIGSSSTSSRIMDSPQEFDTSAAAWVFCFVVGLFLLSIPYLEPVATSPYVLLARLLPAQVANKNKLIRSVGAVLTTWACVNSSTVAPIFTSRIAIYLGKISFALYLTHGLMIRSLGYVLLGRLRTYARAPVREETTLSQFVFIWLCGYAVMLPSCLWAADLFWRSIDMPSVTFARWLDRQLRQSRRCKSSEKMADDSSACVD